MTNFQAVQIHSGIRGPSAGSFSSLESLTSSSSSSSSSSLSLSSSSGAQAVHDAASYQRATGRLDRVYCMIPSMYESSRVQLWTAILDTWGARCDVIKFFVDPPKDNQYIPKTLSSTDGTLVADIVVVPMVRKGGICDDGRPCRHIWEKGKLS